MLKMLWIMCALTAAALVAAGCGGSSKPAYCSNVSDLRQSVDDMKGLELGSGAVSKLKTDLKAVQSNVKAVVSSAKQDFPQQTSALKSSVSSLSSAIDQLPSSPTIQQLVPLGKQISSVVTSAKDLTSATSSACD